MIKHSPKEFIQTINESRSQKKMPLFHYWDRLVKEVREKNDCNAWFCFINVDLKPPEERKKERPTRYYLGNHYPKTYLSQREADCMMLLLRGHTVVGVSKELGLSIKTVACYTNSIKKKMGFKYIRNAVKHITQTDFMLYFNEKGDS